MYIDIHSHILPGLDDGAADIEVALDMLEEAATTGTTHIVATPHFIPDSLDNSPAVIAGKCNELQKAALAKGLNIKICCGSEIFISPDLLELYDKNRICTINDSRYMLVEFPMLSLPLYTSDILFDLQYKRLTPIIAHPERNADIQEDMDILNYYVNRGILTQVNAGSITGIYGKKAQKTALKIIKAGLAHFIASDGHNCIGRNTDLSNAAGFIERKFGLPTMMRLFYLNGLVVLENKMSVQSV